MSSPFQYPLTYNIRIVNPDGTPTMEFLRKWQQQVEINGTIPGLNTAAEVSALLDYLGPDNGDLLRREGGLWEGFPASGDATTFLNGALAFTAPSWAGVTAKPLDFGVFVAGVPDDSELVAAYIFTSAVTFTAGLPGAYGNAVTASGTTNTFDLQKNGVSIGSVVFATSDTATFTFSGDVAFAAGDILQIVADAAASSDTLADISISLKGTRT